MVGTATASGQQRKEEGAAKYGEAIQEWVSRVEQHGVKECQCQVIRKLRRSEP
jgi:hypothetical protein